MTLMRLITIKYFNRLTALVKTKPNCKRVIIIMNIKYSFFCCTGALFMVLYFIMP
jgi:hypothetical protein